MEDINISTLRKQARYLDQKITLLEMKSAYPYRISNPESIEIAENILKDISEENDQIQKEINEDLAIGNNNSEQMMKFLGTMEADTMYIINSLKDMEKQLAKFGLNPLSEEPPEVPVSRVENIVEEIEECNEKLQGTYIVEEPNILKSEELLSRLKP